MTCYVACVCVFVCLFRISMFNFIFLTATCIVELLLKAHIRRRRLVLFTKPVEDLRMVDGAMRAGFSVGELRARLYSKIRQHTCEFDRFPHWSRAVFLELGHADCRETNKQID